MLKRTGRLVLGAVVALIAACDQPPAADVAASDYQKAMLEWTRSMRANGVPDFPDPDAEGRFLIPKTIDVNSEAFKRAQKASEGKFPHGPEEESPQARAQMLAQALEYARSMRANGVANFPDPQVVNGRVILSLPAGVDPNSEVFQKAQKASESKLPSGLGG